MAKKDLDVQVKKTGKIQDGFICLPDPEDVYTWYYIVYGLDWKEYNGGYYMGKIVCAPEYPAQAPRIYLITENGQFYTEKEPGYADGICMSISYYHQESWNPAWKVNQIVIGLLSFWQTEESNGTLGAIYGDRLKQRKEYGETASDVRITLAKKSRQAVLDHEKFFIFKDYADAIGINTVPVVDTWKAHEQKIGDIEAKIEAKKAAEAERKRKEEEAKQIEVERKAEEERIQKMKMIPKQFFKQLKQMGMTDYVGQKNKLKKLSLQKRAGAA